MTLYAVWVPTQREKPGYRSMGALTHACYPKPRTPDPPDNAQPQDMAVRETILRNWFDTISVSGDLTERTWGNEQTDKSHAVYALFEYYEDKYGYEEERPILERREIKRMETHAGPEVNLYFNGSVDPPEFSRAWDY
jgi:hypothetical protein